MLFHCQLLGAVNCRLLTAGLPEIASRLVTMRVIMGNIPYTC